MGWFTVRLVSVILHLLFLFNGLLQQSIKLGKSICVKCQYIQRQNSHLTVTEKQNDENINYQGPADRQQRQRHSDLVTAEPTDSTDSFLFCRRWLNHTAIYIPSWPPNLECLWLNSPMSSGVNNLENISIYNKQYLNNYYFTSAPTRAGPLLLSGRKKRRVGSIEHSSLAQSLSSDQPWWPPSVSSLWCGCDHCWPPGLGTDPQPSVKPSVIEDHFYPWSPSQRAKFFFAFLDELDHFFFFLTLYPSLTKKVCGMTGLQYNPLQPLQDTPMSKPRWQDISLLSSQQFSNLKKTGEMLQQIFSIQSRAWQGRAGQGRAGQGRWLKVREEVQFVVQTRPGLQCSAQHNGW